MSTDPRLVAPALRWARAVVLGSVALGTGVVAHVSAQGRMPGPLALVVLYAVVTAGAALLLGRPAGPTRVVVLLVTGQTLVHGVLTALSGHRGDPPLRRAAALPRPVVAPPPGGASRRGSYYDLAYAGAHPSGSATPVVPAPVQHLLADLSGPHAAMAIAHLVAAVAVGLWLAVGERALWGLLAVVLDGARAAVRAWAGALAVLARVAATVGSARRARPGVRLERARPGRDPARAVRRRGPPMLLAG